MYRRGVWVGDVPFGRRASAVSTGSAQDSAAHPAALLRVQSHLGLDYLVSDVLHRHHGAVQRRLQEQDQRGEPHYPISLNRFNNMNFLYLTLIFFLGVPTDFDESFFI